MVANDWREVVAEWNGEESFIGINKAGLRLQMGAKGDQPGFSPMELLLAGLAGCTGMDIVSILAKKRQSLADFRVIVRGNRAEQPPRVYTDIEVIYVLWGENLEPQAVEQAIRLSEEKYCSASAMLGAVADIQSTYRILQPGEPVPDLSAVAGQ